MGGFLTYKYGPFFAFLAGLWSILALSCDPRRRGPPRQPRLRGRGAVRQAPDRAGEARGARDGRALSMVVPRLRQLVARRSSAIPALGDDIPLSGAVGFALWVGPMGLVSGSVAFALAPFFGRGSAAGIAGVSCSARSSSGATPRTCRRSSRSPSSRAFHWTYGHVPLAGQYDWASLGLVGPRGRRPVRRRRRAVRPPRPRGDDRASRSPACRGLPSAFAARSGRSFGDQLPKALAWGLGIGVFGVHAGRDRAGRSPIADHRVPDLRRHSSRRSSRRRLHLRRLVPPAASSSRWGSSSSASRPRPSSASGPPTRSPGRLEMLLSTPLTRARWAIAGRLGVLLAVAVTTVVFAARHRRLARPSRGARSLTPMAGRSRSASTAPRWSASASRSAGCGGLRWRPRSSPLVIATFLDRPPRAGLKLPDWVHQLALTSHLGQPMIGTWDSVGMVACAGHRYRRDPARRVGDAPAGRRTDGGSPRRRPGTPAGRAREPVGDADRDCRPGRDRALRLGRGGRPALPGLSRRGVGRPVPRRSAPLRDARPRGRPGGAVVGDDPA